MTQGYTKGVPIDTDPTLAADSNQLVPSQAAVVTYVTTSINNHGAGTITGSSGGPLSQSSSNWNILGSGSITTSGASNTLTVQLTGLTNHALLVGAGTATITKLGLGTAGQVLQSGGALADPVFSTATYPSTATGTGTILRADGTNWVATTATYPATTTINQILYSSANNVIGEITAANDGVLISSHTGVPSWLANSGTAGWVLTANTNLPPSWQAPTGGSGITGTVTQYNVAVGAAGNTLTSVGPGSAGQVLQSGGNAANPAYSTATYPATATGTGKILRADGTNWVATTATFPDTAGTSGNVLTSDGTNWVSSSAPTGNLLLTSAVNITSTEIKALRASPKEIIAAPGSNKVIYVIGGLYRFNYGGSNVFTNGQNLALRYTNASGTTVVSSSMTSSIITGSTSLYNSSTAAYEIGFSSGVASSTIVNQKVVLANIGASEITGNAANDNTIDVWLTYCIFNV